MAPYRVDAVTAGLHPRCCVVFGWLIYKSGYLPRSIGILLAIAGGAYVVFSVAQMLSPRFAGTVLFPFVIPVAFVAELALSLWLLAKGSLSRSGTNGRRRLVIDRDPPHVAVDGDDLTVRDSTAGYARSDDRGNRVLSRHDGRM